MKQVSFSGVFFVGSSVNYPDENVEKMAINHMKISQIWL
jgi:hypothetical protein